MHRIDLRELGDLSWHSVLLPRNHRISHLPCYMCASCVCSNSVTRWHFFKDYLCKVVNWLTVFLFLLLFCVSFSLYYYYMCPCHYWKIETKVLNPVACYEDQSLHSLWEMVTVCCSFRIKRAKVYTCTGRKNLSASPPLYCICDISKP